MKFFLLFILLLNSLCAGSNFTLSINKDRIFVCNGFDMELSIYDIISSEQRTVSLKNISRSALVTHFTVYDEFTSYLLDAVSGVIYLLDEKFNLKNSLDVKKNHSTDLYGKIFPSGYNGLLLASENRENIYILKNNILRNIISSDRPFTDFFADGRSIYLLYGNRIHIHTHSGAYLSAITAGKDEKYTEIQATPSRIILKTAERIVSVNRSENTIKYLDIENIVSFAAKDSTLYYISGGVSELKRADL